MGFSSGPDPPDAPYNAESALAAIIANFHAQYEALVKPSQDKTDAILASLDNRLSTVVTKANQSHPAPIPPLEAPTINPPEFTPPADDPLSVAFTAKLQAALNATSNEFSAARITSTPPNAEIVPVVELLSTPAMIPLQEDNVKTVPAVLPKPTAMTGKLTTKPTKPTTTKQPAPTILTLKNPAVAKPLPVKSDPPKQPTTTPSSKTKKMKKMMPTTIKNLERNNPPAAPDLLNNNPHYLRTLPGPQLIQRARLIAAACSPSSSLQRHKKKKAANKKSKIRFRVPASLGHKISPNENSPSQPPSPETTETKKPESPKSTCD